MGSCLSRTRLEKYGKAGRNLGDYFEKLQLGELNDLWTTVRIYKIRQLFAKHASPTTNSVDFAGFKELLPSLEIYSNVRAGLLRTPSRESSRYSIARSEISSTSRTSCGG